MQSKQICRRGCTCICKWSYCHPWFSFQYFLIMTGHLTLLSEYNRTNMGDGVGMVIYVLLSLRQYYFNFIYIPGSNCYVLFKCCSLRTEMQTWSYKAKVHIIISFPQTRNTLQQGDDPLSCQTRCCAILCRGTIAQSTTWSAIRIFTWMPCLCPTVERGMPRGMVHWGLW